MTFDGYYETKTTRPLKQRSKRKRRKWTTFQLQEDRKPGNKLEKNPKTRVKKK